MKETVVLYPSPGIGHLVSMVELGKRLLLLLNDTSFSITILISHAPYNTGATNPYIRRVSSTHPSISFHHLPPVSIPPLHSLSSPHQEALAFRFLRFNNTHLRQALLSISQSSPIRALIFDFFCAVSLEAIPDLHFPTYFFFTSGVSVLAFFLHLPTVHRLTSASFKDLKDTPLHFPGLPPIPASEMPLPMLDRSDEAYDGFLYIAQSMTKVNGIIVNSFEELEPQAKEAISAGACVPDGPTPPIYCIGPLIASDGQGEGEGEGRRNGGGADECLWWLDSQPSQSVVFLSFGSMGLFSEAQLIEIAVGLEKSGVRFLWVVRSPPSSDKSRRFIAPPDPDLESLLPRGFMERTRERGKVVKSWAPQVAILKHESVGGFVSHCGWNSVLESVCGGVPMVAWPLYAEQRMNKVFMVEEMKVALPMDEDDNGFVSSAEVERRVRELMELEQGKVVRERTLAMQDAALAAFRDGGSSYATLTHLAQLWN
ncbi:UDP-glycosyltransferase 88A1-like [Magnolia sinica]|uniref:UDP-glycosyltransferase 88A1-like n=1 Tax=Magnolia sinica TaxID=86752 RepID=UPI00265A1EB2|nr:UDP-glycosyltransferase 88A1-like [Magnolia sinica]